jgi:HEAT repeat protein
MATTTTEILELLRSPDPAIRQLALTELSDVLDETALEPLLVAAVDADATVRELAIGLLEELGDPRARPRSSTL